ncbi:MAG: hypothetical protein DHS20C05_05570 [Hyphococcus sp.]|nr:MAG: hypothetical protein DHS20C05_05570 [Marinicaulis sp.]
MRLTIDRIILLTIAGLLAAGLAASEIARLQQQNQNAALSEQLSETSKKADAALKAIIEPEIIAGAERSVYMVINDKRHYGTAFVIDRDRGILATAAHVAEGFDFDDEEKTFSVINRFSGKPLRIRNSKLHSGYTRFRKLVENYQPADPDSLARSPNFIRIYDIAHDGALLFVDPIDPETGENILGPNMALEDEEKLATLSAGDPIAIIGFPVDTITDNLSEESAASRAERGVIGVTIAPIDLVEANGDPRFDNLIIHRMASAPGNSGGPIINSSGNVVGINSHGTSSYFSNGDKLGQRADVIYDLLDPFREQDLLATLYFPEWTKRLSKWRKLEDVLPYAVYQRFNTENGAKPDRKLKVSELEIKEDKPFTSFVSKPEFSPMQSEFILIADDLATKDKAPAEDQKNKQRQKAEPRPSFLIETQGEYANYKLRLPKSKNHAVFAFDYSLDWFTSGFCPLQFYHRREKETVLKETRGQKMPMLYFPAEPEADKPSSVDFIIRRGQCDTSSKKFLFGIVSWDDHKDDSESKSPLTTTAASAPNIFLTKAEKAGSGLQNTLDCNVSGLGNPENCTRFIKIQNFKVKE